MPEMTPDEISEFAEMLQDVCDQDGGVGICRCPLGALLRSRGASDVSFPPSDTVDRARALPRPAALEFIGGWRGCEYDSPAPPFAQLGALFRQQYPARYEELGR